MGKIKIPNQISGNHIFLKRRMSGCPPNGSITCDVAPIHMKASSSRIISSLIHISGKNNLHNFRSHRPFPLYSTTSNPTSPVHLNVLFLLGSYKTWINKKVWIQSSLASTRQRKHCKRLQVSMMSLLFAL